MTLKTFFNRKGQRPILYPLNPSLKYKQIAMGENDLIQGIFVGLIKKDEVKKLLDGEEEVGLYQ